MKTGLTLQQMATEITRRQISKRDYIACTSAIHLAAPDDGAPAGELSLMVNRMEPVRLHSTMHFRKQLQQHYKVPADYAERIRTTHPELYVETFNTFLHKEPSRNMLRTLDGSARAFLSDRYRPLDDADLMEAVLPTLMEFPDMEVVSAQFTEQRLYFKAVFPRFMGDVKVNDPVQLGIVVSNSEVGAGSLQVMPLIYRLVCKNGLITESYGQRRYHVGKRASADEDTFEMYSDKTRRLDDATFFSKVRDTLRGVLKQATFETILEQMQISTKEPLPADRVKGVVEVIGADNRYTERTQSGILAHLIGGGDLTRYGLINAITRQSQDEEDYETATRLETDGGALLVKTGSNWNSYIDRASYD